MKGRESSGIVKPADSRALADEIAARLTGLVDRERGAIAVRGVSRRDQVYSGAYAEQSPDLMVRFASGYRASWATALGGIPAGHFEDNDKKWAGDHIIDPSLVPGVLFMNRPFGQNGRLVDMAPTILAALGVPRDPIMEGQSLL